MGQVLNGNALDNATLPPSATSATVTGFTIEGSAKVYTPGPTPLSLNDPDTGAPVGTLTLLPSGAYTFVPAPNYMGPVPGINLNVRGSDGQTCVSSLTVDVIAREGWGWGWGRLRA